MLWRLSVFFAFLLYYLLYVSPSGPTQYIFHTSMARYSPLVLKVLLNTNQAYPLAVQTQEV